jgi:hypothetical protein
MIGEPKDIECPSWPIPFEFVLYCTYCTLHDYHIHIGVPEGGLEIDVTLCYVTAPLNILPFHRLVGIFFDSVPDLSFLIFL